MIMRYFIAILLFLCSLSIFAQENATGPKLKLAQVEVNIHDIDSIKRGAKFFATTCMSCHTLKYLRYDPIAKEAGITLEKMPLNVKEWPYGVKPPDLTLETQVRGADWVYTYLHSFYKDTSRPTGANNLLLLNTAMPNIIVPYQGEQVLVKKPMTDMFGDVEWYDLLEITRAGSVPPEEFDQMIQDVINFLSYAAQPYRAEQMKIGWYVLAFLVILFFLMYYLKREYWRDVKQHKD